MIKLHQAPLTPSQIEYIDKSFEKKIRITKELSPLRRVIIDLEDKIETLSTELKAKKRDYAKLWKEYQSTYGTQVGIELDIANSTVYRRYRKLSNEQCI